MATDIGDHFYGRDVHRLTRERLVSVGKVIPLRNLARDFDDQPDEVSYLQSASVAKYIRQRFGLAILREIWKSGYAGIPSATGQDRDTFEKNWRAVVDSAR